MGIITDIVLLFRVWRKIASLSFQDQTLTSWAAIAFLIGKIIKFLLFFVFLHSVISESHSLAGYSRDQVIVFFLVFNIVDITAQAVFRGVYQFRTLVVSGSFDYDLLKPLPSYFRPLFGWADVADFLTLIPLWIGFIFFIESRNLIQDPLLYVVFACMLLVSFIVAFSFHLLVSAFGIISTEVDHIIWVYRDLAGMARFPTDIYPKLIQFGLTFFVPIILLITIPAKSILGFASPVSIAISFTFSMTFLITSLLVWKKAVAHYSSASS